MTYPYKEYREYHLGEADWRKAIYKWIEPYHKSILDVGCGSGWLYANLKNAGVDIKYKGVDLDKGFIGGAKLDYPEAEWEVQDAENLKEETNSWDIVVLIHVLENCPNWKKAIEEAFRVSNGRVIINFWHGWVSETYHSVKEQDKENYDFFRETESNWFGKEDLQEAFLETFGFTIDEPTETFVVPSAGEIPHIYHYFAIWVPGRKIQ